MYPGVPKTDAECQKKKDRVGIGRHVISMILSWWAVENFTSEDVAGIKITSEQDPSVSERVTDLDEFLMNIHYKHVMGAWRAFNGYS